MRIVPAIMNEFLKPPITVASRNMDSNTSGTAYATKGSKFTPLRNYLCYGVLAFILTNTGGSSASYRGYLWTKSGTTIGAFLRKSHLWIPPGLSTLYTGVNFLFESPVVLVSGTSYTIAVGRTDGADNFSLPIKAGSGSGKLALACRDVNGQEHVAKANPAAGDTVATANTVQNAVFPIVQRLK